MCTSPRSMLFGFAVTSLLACGGNVVFVTDGAGGGDTTNGPTGTGGLGPTGSSVVGTPVTCDDLLNAMDSAYAAATECDPAGSNQQCDGSVVLLDTCACPSVLANSQSPDLAKLANDAYNHWVDAGCGPFACGGACFPADIGGGCVAGKGTGFCEVFQGG